MKVKTEMPASQEDEEIDVSSTYDAVPEQSAMDVLQSIDKEPHTEEWAQNTTLPYVDAYCANINDLLNMIFFISVTIIKG